MSLNRYTEYCPICGAVLKESSLDADLKEVRAAQEGGAVEGGEDAEKLEGDEQKSLPPAEEESPDVDLPADDGELPADGAAAPPETTEPVEEGGGDMPELEEAPELESLPELESTEPPE